MTDEQNNSVMPQALVPLAEQLPTVLPTVVLDDLVPFPAAVLPITLEQPERRDAVLHARSNTGIFYLLNRRGSPIGEGSDLPDAVDPALFTIEERESLTQDAIVDTAGEQSATRLPKAPLPISSLAPVGMVARLLRLFRLPDDRLSALVHLVRRAQPLEVLKSHPFPILRVFYPPETVRDEGELEAVLRQLRLNLRKFLDEHTTVPDEVRIAAANIDTPAALADFVAQHLSRDFEERLKFLTELDVGVRLRDALEVVVRELDLQTLGNRITQEIREKIEKHQRDYFLREQLKAIRVELGEEKDPAALAVAELEAKLDAAGLPEHARTRADEELRRLKLLPVESPEHNVIRSYLDWIASLPWSSGSEDARDLDDARGILDEDHYGLEEVKDRIVEFLAVRQLSPQTPGSMLCFAGPPGVGKTSLGQSIARTLGRQFHRLSVGGMRDEAEIKGHRRTYIGAMPGRILQGLKQVQTNNPLFMIDEIDKMGADWRGDPSSAMLEVLDPAQNHAFLDHYLDLTFDLSQVMFIATANVKAEIPRPLLDRMEVIDLPGYIPEEKIEIAVRHLAPRQRQRHGLSTRELRLGRPALKRIIAEYTHEAGVRELERQISKICRKRATQTIRRTGGKAQVGGGDVPGLLGPPKVHDDRIQRRPTSGVAVGLAWTPVGGDVLFIEAVSMPGKGAVRVTGHLGEVMQESANLAVSYVRSRADALGVDPSTFSDRDLHLHFPAGAVPKDGPSAGITVTTALISLLTDKPIRPRLAMTGEMTLRGDVLPVGGIREKVVAARRAGVRTVIVPERNRVDVEEIPEEVTGQLSVVYASTYDNVLSAAFGAKSAGRPRGEENG